MELCFAGKNYRFDQCGVVMYLDSDNWFKVLIEYEDEQIQGVGSVVTNHGYSDWATTDITYRNKRSNTPFYFGEI